MLIQTTMTVAHTAMDFFFFFKLHYCFIVLFSLYDLTQNLFSYNTDQLMPVQAGVAFI